MTDSLLEFRLRRSVKIAQQDSARAHINDALQVLAGIQPMNVTPVDLEGYLLAVEGHLMQAATMLKESK